MPVSLDDRITVLVFEDEDTAKVRAEVDHIHGIINKLAANDEAEDRTYLVALLHRTVHFVERAMAGTTQFPPGFHAVTRTGQHLICGTGGLMQPGISPEERHAAMAEFFLNNDVKAYVAFSEALMSSISAPPEEQDGGPHKIMEVGPGAHVAQTIDVAMFSAESDTHQIILSFEIKDRQIDSNDPLLVAKQSKDGSTETSALMSRPLLPQNKVLN